MTRKTNEFIYNASPVAISGVGGSGTRVVATLVNNLNIFIGNTVNKANDNLQFVKARELLSESDQSIRDELIFRELRSFEEKMHRAFLDQHGRYSNWGWKVPGQFHLLKYTAEYFPKLKYIHVIRNGLDMAFSKNTNQLRNWGAFHGITVDDPEDPTLALRYWIRANKFALNEGVKHLGKRFLVLNYDELCKEPEHSINKISLFLTEDLVLTEEKQEVLRSLVSPPDSIGRYKHHDYKSIFSSDSIDEVRKLGFSV